MSIELDTRQRAMLQEMGVHVWLPEIAAPVATKIAIEDIAANAMAAGVIAQKALNKQAARPAPAPVPVGTVPTELAPGMAEMDWPALAQTVADCQACALCSGRRAPVFEAGDIALATDWRADWLVVGDPPDEAEERLGAPFADAAGQLLDNMLKAVGVSRLGAAGSTVPALASQRAYATNVVKCRTDPVRNPTPQELAVCEHFLRREVALVQPKVIVAMGRFAAQTLLHGSLPEGSKTPFGKLRGQIYRYQGIPVVVSYHPSNLLRTPQDKGRAWADLCLAMDVLKRGE
jgi:DNA polymerase